MSDTEIREIAAEAEQTIWILFTTDNGDVWMEFETIEVVDAE